MVAAGHLWCAAECRSSSFANRLCGSGVVRWDVRRPRSWAITLWWSVSTFERSTQAAMRAEREPRALHCHGRSFVNY